ncbi:hypothetical protein ACQP1G_45415 [Nocardia sp. CA-107356]|uniref:hypothetical protein n=1 Tax=Nocardia sp. CA-107356 TaxID=3239972 RepID=UPI003D92C77A
MLFTFDRAHGAAEGFGAGRAIEVAVMLKKVGAGRHGVRATASIDSTSRISSDRPAGWRGVDARQDVVTTDGAEMPPNSDRQRRHGAR